MFAFLNMLRHCVESAVWTTPSVAVLAMDPVRVATSASPLFLRYATPGMGVLGHCNTGLARNCRAISVYMIPCLIWRGRGGYLRVRWDYLFRFVVRGVISSIYRMRSFVYVSHIFFVSQILQAVLLPFGPIKQLVPVSNIFEFQYLTLINNIRTSILQESFILFIRIRFLDKSFVFSNNPHVLNCSNWEFKNSKKRESGLY